jgi:lambda family phage portal protein
MIGELGRVLQRVGGRLAGDRPAPTSVRAARELSAAFDAATSRGFDSATWGEADSLSADADADAGKRATMRSRARHVVTNWPLARGMVNTLADDTVGTGPRLSVAVADDLNPRGLSDDDAAQLEAAWSRWAQAVGLNEKLRLIRKARVSDGEVFGRMVTNTLVARRVRVSLDLRILEADQVASLGVSADDDRNVDGIRFDTQGNPIAYEILRRHPGSTDATLGSPYESELVRADRVLHYFAPDRPGQSRGVPEFSSAVRLAGQHWRYFTATLQAAETAANVAAYMRTTATMTGDEAATFEALDIEAGSMLTLPDGWDIAQIDAKHPTAMFGEVHRAMLAACARCLSMPINVALGDSSSHNYASGRLDHQIYRSAIKVERDRLAELVLEPLFAAWLDEASLVEGLLPQSVREIAIPAHQWTWPGWPHVDPSKEASAAEVNLRTGATTLRHIWHERGGDWREAMQQLARERREADRLGLTMPEAMADATSGRDDEGNE